MVHNGDSTGEPLQQGARTDIAGDPDLQRLSECADLQVSEGAPDIRGWPAVARDGARLGTVDDLIVSRSSMRTRLLDVRADARGHTLVPVGAAELDEGRRVVVIDTPSPQEFAAQPRHLEPERDASVGAQQPTPSNSAEREIRMPVMAEEAVVTKRVVPREMLVIKKRLVTQHETVETDLRRERVDVEQHVEPPARDPRQDRRL